MNIERMLNLGRLLKNNSLPPMEVIMKNKLEKLIECFENPSGYIYTIMKLPNQDTPELIVNSTKSAHIKLNYIRNIYNPDLTMKSNPEIKILEYGWSVDLDIITEQYQNLLEEMK
jgi:hypothetical protein